MLNINRLSFYTVYLSANQSYLVVSQDAEKYTEYFLINLGIDYRIRWHKLDSGTPKLYLSRMEKPN